MTATSGADSIPLTDSLPGANSIVLRDSLACADLMPGAVGAGSFWTGMTAWFGTDESTSDVLKSIDAAWPAS